MFGGFSAQPSTGFFKSHFTFVSRLMQSLSILVADHQPIFVEGLRSVLSATAVQLGVTCSVQSVAQTGEQLFQQLRSRPTDLLLLDPSLPDSDGVEIVPSLKKHFLGLRILIVTTHNDPRLVKAALKGGADGYLLKTASQNELLRAIREVTDGHTFLGQGVTSTLSVSAQQAAETPLLEDVFARKYHLTRRELEVMRYIGLALTNREIGERLYISDQTVSVHRKNIMRKLQVNSTASLVRIVFEHNLVETAA